LTIGLANFFWIPTSIYFGKRPCFLVASFTFFACTLWAGGAQSFHSLVAARVISSFVAAVAEAFATSSIADLFFLHERGWWMGVWSLSAGTGGPLGSIISGFVITALGWRWHCWLSGILAGFSAFSVLLFFPEIQYRRKSATGQEAVMSGDPQTDSGPGEKDAPQVHEPTDTASSEISLPRKKTFLQELKPWSPLNTETSYWRLVLRPWPMLVYPATLYSFLTFAAVLGWLLCILTTYASVFQAPPYNMSPGISSLINIASIIGAFIGGYAGGGLTDKIAEWQARRNNGIFEPEARLVALVIPFFAVPLGTLMYGLGVQNQTSWAVPFIGYGFVNFGQVTIPAITMTYVIDSYFPVAYEAMLLINGLKNVFGFGFSFAVVPWVTLSGYKGTFCTMVGIQCALMLFGLPLWYWGKQIRHATASWKVITW